MTIAVFNLLSSIMTNDKLQIMGGKGLRPTSAHTPRLEIYHSPSVTAAPRAGR